MTGNKKSIFKNETEKKKKKKNVKIKHQISCDLQFVETHRISLECNLVVVENEG